MNLKKTITFFFLFIGMIFYAQETEFEKPNYKKIKKQTFKKKSEFYYPKLMKRYLGADISMTIKDKRYLYYGFTFQKEYQPYAKSKEKPEIIKLLSNSEITETELKELVRLTKLHLINFPFDINMLNAQIYAYKKLKLKYDAFKVSNQVKTIKEVLLSSGDGIGQRTAFHVINTSHELEILKMLGYEQSGIRTAINEFEYLRIKPNPKDIKGLYFNLSRGEEAINN